LSEACSLQRRPWSVFAVALVPLLLLTWRFNFLCDDAFITFRYSRNLVQGLGLVYNPGEAVEGYSEFLWALILAAGEWVGLSPLILSRVLSVASAVVMVHFTTRLLAERVACSPVASHGAALFLGCLPPLGVWATGGLATLPFTAAITVLFFLTWGCDAPAKGWKLGLVASVATLLRADGAWWVAFTLGPAILIGLRRRRPAAWRPALVGAVISGAVFLAHVGWRVATYGDWLPNTARVKVGLSAYAAARGANYVLHFLLTFPGVVLALGLGALALGSPTRRLLPAGVLVAATAIYVVLVGGDFMAFDRFMVPMLPFTALVLGAGLGRMEERWGWRASAGGSLACAALVITPAWGLHPVPQDTRAAFSVRHNRQDVSRRRSELEQWVNMDYQAREWSALGKALALVSKPDDVLVYGAVGAIGWYSGLRLLDRNGLITPSVAKLPPQTDPPKSPGHDKTVPPEFFAQAKPTWLFVTWVPERGADWRQAVRATGDPLLLAYLERGQLRELPLPTDTHPYPGNYLIVVPGR
jgi:arabinofuranosyltransferase